MPMNPEMITDFPTVANAELSDVYVAVQGYVSPSSLGLTVQETGLQIAQMCANYTVMNYGGNPNGNLAGTRYQLCYDYLGKGLYVCSTTGSSTTAIWTLVGVNPVSPFAISSVKSQNFSSSGTYIPSAGMLYCTVQLWGAGGGSGGSTGGAGFSAAGGGGGGAYSQSVFTVANIGTTAAITIGLGGLAGVSGGATPGGNGGDSTFICTGTGTAMTAGGGIGGIGSPTSSTTGGDMGISAGGVASGGNMSNFHGGSSAFCFSYYPGELLIPGQGGDSPMGAPGQPGGVIAIGGNGFVPGAGAGGSSASSSGFAGGVGGSGYCLITEYCNQA